MLSMCVLSRCKISNLQLRSLAFTKAMRARSFVSSWKIGSCHRPRRKVIDGLPVGLSGCLAGEIWQSAFLLYVFSQVN